MTQSSTEITEDFLWGAGILPIAYQLRSLDSQIQSYLTYSNSGIPKNSVIRPERR